MKTFAFVLLILALMLPPLAYAQQYAGLTPNGYSIQITYDDGYSSFTPMYGMEFKGRTSFTLAPRNIIKRAVKDSEQVSLVSIATKLDGSDWEVRVSVTFGDFYDQGSKPIATYRVAEGEKVRVKEMAAYGARPFEVSIVKVVSVPPIQPEVINQTNSISVLNVLATTLPDPFQLELKNNSEKSIRALEIATRKRKSTLSIQWPQAKSWDRSLIEAGGTYKLVVASAGRNQTVNSEYVPDQTTIIEISTVVFADGSYEGKPYLAATKRGEDVGSKQQLERVLHLLEAALESTEVAPKQTLLNLRQDAALLSEEIDIVWLKKLQQNFPTLNDNERNNLPNFVKYGLHQVKKDFLKELGDYEKTEKLADRSSERDWLMKAEVKYRKWQETLP